MAFPYKKILCPVEFDDYCAAAIKEAAALALSSGGQLFLLHVVHINPLTAQGAIEGFAASEMYEAQVNLARGKVDLMLAGLPAGVRPEVAIEVGAPADVILSMEDKLEADLVVMATHGSGLKRMVMGSVAENVLHHSRIPVLMVRPPAPKAPQA